MGMLPVSFPPSSILPVHPPSFLPILHAPGFHFDNCLGVPSPFAFPAAPQWCQASPIVVFPTTHVLGGLGTCPPTQQNFLGCVEKKKQDRAAPVGPP